MLPSSSIIVNPSVIAIGIPGRWPRNCADLKIRIVIINRRVAIYSRTFKILCTHLSSLTHLLSAVEILQCRVVTPVIRYRLPLIRLPLLPLIIGITLKHISIPVRKYIVRSIILRSWHLHLRRSRCQRRRSFRCRCSRLTLLLNLGKTAILVEAWSC